VALLRVDRSLRRAAPPAKVPNDSPSEPEISPEMLEACRAASLLIGGPQIRRLGVTSSVREEGRTTVAEAMAQVQQSEFGRRVALVDMDFENPSLARRHGLEPWPGLAELSRGEVGLDEVMQPFSEGIYLVATGRIPETASRVVSDIVISGLVVELSERVDIVVADLPPLLGGGTGQVAARAFEDLILVVRAGVTPAARIREATSDLHVAPNVLLNGAYSSLPSWLRRLLGQ
jgi:Mrp family chromosome partitioning ATPase